MVSLVAPTNKGPYWDVTVATRFTEAFVDFRPGVKYRISQAVYNLISARCATAVQVPFA